MRELLAATNPRQIDSSPRLTSCRMVFESSIRDKSPMPPFFTALLGTASLLTVGLIVRVFLVSPAQGYNGIGELLLMVAAASLRWALLAILLAVAAQPGPRRQST